MSTPTWLGASDRLARQRLVETLDPERDMERIAHAFYEDFGNVLLVQGVHSLLATFVNPRMSHLMHGTGQMLEHTAKRMLDTALLTDTVIKHGFGPGPGRQAGRRVNAMHRQYDIHPDDYVFVGCDNPVQALHVTGSFGWRDVTEQERLAVPRFFARLARVFGAHRALPETLDGMRAEWDAYLDREARFDPVNRELADAVLSWAAARVPDAFRPALREALVAHLDPRVAGACGLEIADDDTRRRTADVLRLVGSADPRPDGAPDSLRHMADVVYGRDWTVERLGSHVHE